MNASVTPHSHQNVVFWDFLNFSCFSGYLEILHCSCNMHCNYFWRYFHVLNELLYMYFLLYNIFPILLLVVFNLVLLSYKSYLYILDTRFLSDMCVANIFSHSIAFSVESFEELTLLILIKSNVIFLIDAFFVISKKTFHSLS